MNRVIDNIVSALCESHINEAPQYTRDDIKNIDVKSIKPEKKDMDRARGLAWRGSTFKGNGRPWASEASKMAKLIKDPIKLVRRSKAVYALYQDNYSNDRDSDVWTPFRRALIEMNFTGEQIQDIVQTADKNDVAQKTIKEVKKAEKDDKKSTPSISTKSAPVSVTRKVIPADDATFMSVSNKGDSPFA